MITWLEQWMNPQQAREVIAETLLVFDISLLIFIVTHLQRELRLRGWRGTRERLGNRAALAVGVHIVGLTIIRGWTTAQYYFTGRGVDPDAIASAYPIALIGLFFAVIGMGCAIRVFSPVRWGNWGWVITFMAAIGFVGFMQV